MMIHERLSSVNIGLREISCSYYVSSLYIVSSMLQKWSISHQFSVRLKIQLDMVDYLRFSENFHNMKRYFWKTRYGILTGSYSLTVKVVCKDIQALVTTSSSTFYVVLSASNYDEST